MDEITKLEASIFRIHEQREALEAQFQRLQQVEVGMRQQLQGLRQKEAARQEAKKAEQEAEASKPVPVEEINSKIAGNTLVANKVTVDGKLLHVPADVALDKIEPSMTADSVRLPKVDKVVKQAVNKATK